MKMQRSKRIKWVLTATLALSGVTILTGCESDEVRAVVAGVELAADLILDRDIDSHDDISFGNWLLDEIG